MESVTICLSCRCGVSAFVQVLCQHVSLGLHLPTGLTVELLQKEPAHHEEVIEKLFSEVCGLEDCTKIPDPQVDSRLQGGEHTAQHQIYDDNNNNKNNTFYTRNLVQSALKQATYIKYIIKRNKH